MRKIVNVVKQLAKLTLVILAITALSYPVSAHLIPMSWGFPVMFQNASLTGMQTSTASNSDLQSANVAFPTSGFGGGFPGSAFPTMSQSSRQNGFLSNFGFQNQNQNMLFAYPYISIGGSPVPGMGIP